ncbi:hypothetical protein OAF91_02290 [Akkermansiaceae bacterium]|nr:hypothetical protein [Akkermansiaceae bacterium]
MTDQPTKMEWRFNKLTKNDTNKNPSHLEFFHDEALNSPVDAFVREDIQNRLDARARNKNRIKVEYSLCGPKASTELAPWFKNLGSHLSAEGVEEELNYKPKIGAGATWLVAEDFNTTGLNGDPNCFQDPPPSKKPRNDFYWFIRNVGRSGKSGSERGRWGLGKIVYPAASTIRSFFAYSVQENSLKNLLIGRSVLSIHQLNNNQHDSEGYFGKYSDPKHEFFATPSHEEKIIKRFIKDFQITRSPDQPGLSIVVPFPSDDITFDGLIKSIIKHWFMVLIEGRLEVSVRLAGEVVIINGDTLNKVIEGHFENALQQKKLLREINFARLVDDFDQSGDDFFTLNPPTKGKAPSWNSLEKLFESENKVDMARNLYQAGNPIGFEVPLDISKEKEKTVSTASFEVFLQRTDDPLPASEQFLRDGMAILGLSRLRESGIIALVRAENNALGNLLGDAENPSHTKWERNGKHFRGKYKYGHSILTMVKQSAERISTFLTTSNEGLDTEVLKSLFFLPEEGNGKTKKNQKKGGHKVPDTPDLPPKKNYVSLAKRNGGFSIKANPEASSLPDRITIRAAYNVDRGNAFKNHHSADFDLSKHTSLDFEGLDIEQASINRLVFKVTSPHFKFSAEGFDVNRDLILDVRAEVLAA